VPVGRQGAVLLNLRSDGPCCLLMARPIAGRQRQKEECPIDIVNMSIDYCTVRESVESKLNYR
jgi:hypothetical protein